MWPSSVGQCFLRAEKEETSEFQITRKRKIFQTFSNVFFRNFFPELFSRNKNNAVGTFAQYLHVYIPDDLDCARDPVNAVHVLQRKQLVVQRSLHRCVYKANPREYRLLLHATRHVNSTVSSFASTWHPWSLVSSDDGSPSLPIRLSPNARVLSSRSSSGYEAGGSPGPWVTRERAFTSPFSSSAICEIPVLGRGRAGNALPHFGFLMGFFGEHDGRHLRW